MAREPPRHQRKPRVDDPRYELTIRTPAMQARADRARRIKRGGIAVALILALLTPGTIDEVAPAPCSHVWLC